MLGRFCMCRVGCESIRCVESFKHEVNDCIEIECDCWRWMVKRDPPCVRSPEMRQPSVRGVDTTSWYRVLDT